MEKNKSLNKIDKVSKLNKISTYVELNQYKEAMTLLQTIDVTKIRKYDDLLMIVDVYIRNNKYMEAKKILENLYRKTATRKVLTKLIYISIKTDNFVDAEKYYAEYLKHAVNDASSYIYRYKIDKAKDKDYDTLIDSLEKLCEIDYSEEWAYELTKYYHKAGYNELCIKECDKIILWFSEGKVVEKAKLLKEFHENGNHKNNNEGILDGNLNEDFSATRKLDEIAKQVKEEVKKQREIENSDIVESKEDDSDLDCILGEEDTEQKENIDNELSVIISDNNEIIKKDDYTDEKEVNIENIEDEKDDKESDMKDEQESTSEMISDIEGNYEEEKSIDDRKSSYVNSDSIIIDSRIDEILKENMNDLELSDSLDVFFDSDMNKMYTKDSDISITKVDNMADALSLSDTDDKINIGVKFISDETVDEITEEKSDEILDEKELNLDKTEDLEESNDNSNELVTDNDDTKDENEEKVDNNLFDDEKDSNSTEKLEQEIEQEMIENEDVVEQDDGDNSIISESEDNKFDGIFNALSSSVSKIVDDVMGSFSESETESNVAKFDDKNTENKDILDSNSDKLNDNIKVSIEKNEAPIVEYDESLKAVTKENLDYIEIDPDIFCNYFDIEYLNYSIKKGIYNLQTNMLHANFIISGPSLSGRTTLARMLAKQLFDMGYIQTNKIARINGEIFNKVDLQEKSVKLLDGCIIIQKAENVSKKAYDDLMKMIACFPGRIVVFLETTSVDNIYEINSDLREFFGSIIEMPEYKLEDLIGFAHSYAAAEEFYISDSAESVLEKALANRMKIGSNNTTMQDFGYVMNIIDKTIDKVDARELYDIDDGNISDVRVIEKKDIE